MKPSKPPQDAWFREWLAYHIGTFPRNDWPAPSRENWGFYNLFYRVFVELGIDKETATLATDRVAYHAMDEPIRFLENHPGRMRDELRAILRERIAENAQAPNAGPVDVIAEQRAFDHWMDDTEENREAMRALVRDRFPELAGSPAAVEKLARAWHEYPDAIPAPREVQATRGNAVPDPARLQRLFGIKPGEKLPPIGPDVAR